jgi:hypothetical protein
MPVRNSFSSGGGGADVKKPTAMGTTSKWSGDQGFSEKCGTSFCLIALDLRSRITLR